jgi:tight adherence protein B
MGGVRVIAALLALCAAAGTYLVYDAFLASARGATAHDDAAPAAAARATTPRPGLRVWLAQAGLDDVDPREFVAVSCALGVVGAVLGWLVFAGIPAAVALGAFALSFPVAGYRVRRRNRIAVASESWPRLIEEIRVQAGSLGRSIPHALLDVGMRGPEELRGAFAAAHREWMISTDFARTVAVLKARLADPTADMVCETLLVAHEVGGSDIDRRLEALALDRMQDCQGRKDARARQAGARFARRFVLFVPFGMALAGMSVGDGRAAYRSTTGQLLALAGIGLVAACWIWAGRVMRLPQEERVFAR